MTLNDKLMLDLKEAELNDDDSWQIETSQLSNTDDFFNAYLDDKNSQIFD